MSDWDEGKRWKKQGESCRLDLVATAEILSWTCPRFATLRNSLKIEKGGKSFKIVKKIEMSTKFHVWKKIVKMTFSGFSGNKTLVLTENSEWLQISFKWFWTVHNQNEKEIKIYWIRMSQIFLWKCRETNKRVHSKQNNKIKWLMALKGLCKGSVNFPRTEDFLFFWFSHELAFFSDVEDRDPKDVFELKQF